MEIPVPTTGKALSTIKPKVVTFLSCVNICHAYTVTIPFLLQCIFAPELQQVFEKELQNFMILLGTLGMLY